MIDFGHFPKNTTPEGMTAIETEEEFKAPDPVPEMLNQICMAHKKLENLLTSLTNQAPSSFIRKIAREFHRLQTKAVQQCDLNKRLEAPFWKNEVLT